MSVEIRRPIRRMAAENPTWVKSASLTAAHDLRIDPVNPEAKVRDEAGADNPGIRYPRFARRDRYLSSIPAPH